MSTIIKDKILDILKKEGIMSISTMAEKLKLRRDYLSGYLNALTDCRILKESVVGKAKVYQIRRLDRYGKI